MEFYDLLRPGTLNTLKYGERLLAGISPETAARKPKADGITLEINHPVFVFGHLALYPVQLARMLEVDAQAMEVPATYFDLFKAGTPCLDDPSGSIYPSITELKEKFFTGYHAILEALPSVREGVLAKELEDPSRRERFNTTGAFLAYILLAHPQTHFGQISAWRRCMKLPPV